MVRADEAPMRYLPIVATLAMLALPGAAQAQDVRLETIHHGFDPGLDESMIVGREACTVQRWNGPAPTCLTIETTDQLWGAWAESSSRLHFVNGEMIEGVRVEFKFYKFHPLRRELYYAMGMLGGVMTPGGLVISYASVPTYDPQHNAPQCDYGRWIVQLPDDTLRASDDAPQEYVDACGLRRVSDTPTRQTQQAPPTRPNAAKPRTATCAPIRYIRKRVAVTSAGLQCSMARSVLARFMRTRSKPRGWQCRMMRKAATCSTTARPAKRIVGRWR